MSHIEMEEPLTSTVRPHAIITIRIIKSFPFRNVKNVILRGVDLKTTTAGELLAQVQAKINSEGGLRPYRSVKYDAVKVYTHAHGSKTMNLVINMEHDEDWILDLESTKSLYEFGVENETELSVFNLNDYEEYKKNPEEKW